MPGVELVGVVDLERQRAQEIADAYGTRVLTELTPLPGAVDAVTIAVPDGIARGGGARRFSRRASPVLVEKPLARSLAEADGLLAPRARAGRCWPSATPSDSIRLSWRRGRMLGVPRFIEVHRLGTFPDRSLDIDVVFDLMIHDLDVVLSIVDSPVAAIDAVGVPVLTPRIDIANVRLRFASGCIANLTASRISRDRVRKIRFFQTGLVRRDRLRGAGAGGVAAGAAAGRSCRASRAASRPVANEEPLKRELADFVDAVRTGRAPGVTGEDGRRALAAAQQITEQMTMAGEPVR